MYFLNSVHLTGLLLLGLLLLTHMERILAKDDSKTVWKGKGSTAKLKEIMIGRCFNYLGTINPNAGQSSGAILQYTDVTHNVIPLENTLIGYMLNGLNWCGKLSSPEPNFEACPEWNNCVNNSMRSFWRAASESYAMKAHGEVTVMLNGSARVKAFRTNSIFGEIELGKLDNKRVTSVHLWIMDNVDGPDKESCSIGSVSELEKVLKEKKIMYSCKDNYKPVKMLQCLFKVDHPSCELDSKL
ncbi:ADP-ribosyl cyclase/cyclic ADP-ribose hydrolase 1-like isoform X1 [Carcharodon carcharias]|uniref:ADP-ribosyl cyclase/cyclic ADP-ribose hydrolase 1-like isoform X1 n=1 Tax=Carcharodon carcharias TaxID=13397 RepID=UPI001B7F5E4F|nr:ADP-ribosyl cyclase/cyclic ADP-ribose hydrolase 1-like isoform X1 [Carcharodon carcharias]